MYLKRYNRSSYLYTMTCVPYTTGTWEATLIRKAGWRSHRRTTLLSIIASGRRSCHVAAAVLRHAVTASRPGRHRRKTSRPSAVTSFVRRLRGADMPRGPTGSPPAPPLSPAVYPPPKGIMRYVNGHLIII